MDPISKMMVLGLHHNIKSWFSHNTEVALDQSGKASMTPPHNRTSKQTPSTLGFILIPLANPLLTLTLFSLLCIKRPTSFQETQNKTHIIFYMFELHVCVLHIYLYVWQQLFFYSAREEKCAKSVYIYVYIVFLPAFYRKWLAIW